VLCVQQIIPDDGQRNCPKHVEFYSKYKFEKLVHLVGFIVRIRFFNTNVSFMGNHTPLNVMYTTCNLF